MDLKECGDGSCPEDNRVAPPEGISDAADAAAMEMATDTAPAPSWFSFKGLLLWLALGGLIFATLCILERFKEAFLFGV